MFDFPTKVEALDAVPENYRSLYHEKEGEGFVLDGDLAKKFEAGTGLVTALEKERKRAADRQRELAAWQEMGETPEAAKSVYEAKLNEAMTKVGELQKLVDSKGEATAQFEKWKSEIEAKYRKELEAVSSEVSKRDREIENLLIDGEAKSALADLKGNLKVLLPHVRAQVKIFEEGGRRVARPVDEDGDPRSDGKGGYMTIRQLVEEMKQSDDFSANFAGDTTSGSGTAPGPAKVKIAGTYTLSEWQTKVASAKPDERQQLLRQRAEGRIKVA